MMTVLVVVGMIDSTSIILLQALIYGLIPGATAMCIILLNIMAGSHEESSGVPYAAKQPDIFAGIKVLPSEEAELFAQLERAEAIGKYKKS